MKKIKVYLISFGMREIQRSFFTKYRMDNDVRQRRELGKNNNMLLTFYRSLQTASFSPSLFLCLWSNVEGCGGSSWILQDSREIGPSFVSHINWHQRTRGYLRSPSANRCNQWSSWVCFYNLGGKDEILMWNFLYKAAWRLAEQP